MGDSHRESGWFNCPVVDRRVRIHTTVLTKKGTSLRLIRGVDCDEASVCPEVGKPDGRGGVSFDWDKCAIPFHEKNRKKGK